MAKEKYSIGGGHGNLRLHWLRLGKDSLYECFKASVLLNVIEESNVMIMMIFTSQKA